MEDDEMVGNWYVRYRIPEMTGDKIHQQGPYKFDWVADKHKQDIAGYDGVADARVERVSAE